MTKKLSKRDIINELWHRGNLQWKLHENQKQLYKLFHGTDKKRSVWLLSRRSGKTYALVCTAIEECLKSDGRIVKFLAPTQKQVETNLRPLFHEILADCPPNIKPSFSTKNSVWHFPNGSEIQLAGTDKGNGDKLRGGNAHLSIIDEAGMCSDLKYMVNSILMPSMLLTGGKLILATTPPRDSDHEFMHFLEEAAENKTLTIKTIYDNPMLSKEMLQECIDESGGVETESFRREYMCEIIKNADNSVIPEFTEELKAKIVKEWPIPPFFDNYVSMDVGFKDLTVVLFGFYDFRAGKLIIQREIVRQGKDMRLDEFSKDIMHMEEKLWKNSMSGEIKRPYARVSDIDYIVIQEIARHTANQITFNIAKKDNKEASINDLRIMLLQEKIIIDPSCVTLINHLTHVKRKSKDSHLFARSVDKGHYDACDALIYMKNSLNKTNNPYPAAYGMNTQDLFVANPTNFYGNNNLDMYKKIFKVRKK